MLRLDTKVLFIVYVCLIEMCAYSQYTNSSNNNKTNNSNTVLPTDIFKLLQQQNEQFSQANTPMPIYYQQSQPSILQALLLQHAAQHYGNNVDILNKIDINNFKQINTYFDQPKKERQPTKQVEWYSLSFPLTSQEQQEQFMTTPEKFNKQIKLPANKRAKITNEHYKPIAMKQAQNQQPKNKFQYSISESEGKLITLLQQLPATHSQQNILLQLHAQNYQQEPLLLYSTADVQPDTMNTFDDSASSATQNNNNNDVFQFLLPKFNSRTENLVQSKTCETCCNIEENPCNMCCDNGPLLSAAALKSATG